MKAGTRIVVAIFCVPILFGCASRPGDEAARLATAGSRDMAASKFSDAYSKLQQASKLRPDVAEYHVGAGMAAARLGKEPEAEKQYSAAEKILAREAEHDPEKIDDEAMALVLLGRSAEATRVLEEGAERYPESQNLQQLASDPGSFIVGLRSYSLKGVEPQGGANRKQPSGTDAERTSGAAASRRSP